MNSVIQKPSNTCFVLFIACCLLVFSCKKEEADKDSSAISYILLNNNPYSTISSIVSIDTTYNDHTYVIENWSQFLGDTLYTRLEFDTTHPYGTYTFDVGFYSTDKTARLDVKSKSLEGYTEKYPFKTTCEVSAANGKYTFVFINIAIRNESPNLKGDYFIVSGNLVEP